MELIMQSRCQFVCVNICVCVCLCMRAPERSTCICAGWGRGPCTCARGYHNLYIESLRVHLSDAFHRCVRAWLGKWRLAASLLGDALHLHAARTRATFVNQAPMCADWGKGAHGCTHSLHMCHTHRCMLPVCARLAEKVDPRRIGNRR